MKLVKCILLSLMVTGSAFAQGNGLQILSFGANGRLVWSNTYPAGIYGVEWAPTLNGPWRDHWRGLNDLALTGQTAQVDVPMYYRVKCATNLFIPMPVGSFFEMTASNVAGMAWTDRMTTIGTQYFPSKGKEYMVLEGTTSRYPGASQIQFGRSTTNAMLGVDADCGFEEVWMTNAPVGTSWTNTPCGDLTVITYLGNETVTVPLGTFNCMKIRKQEYNTSHPNPVWIEWWQPGMGLVQWVDYFVEPSELPPIYYRLSARGLNP